MGLLKKKETAPEPYKPEVTEAVKEAPKVIVCQAPVDGKPCGKPLAIGQTYVCTAHVRSN